VKLRLVQFSSQNRSAVEEMAKEMVPAIKARAGCQGCYFFADDDAGDYGLAVVWDSQEAADAASEVFYPILKKGVEAAAATDLNRRLFEIYEP
jgi:hypothetical protein